MLFINISWDFISIFWDNINYVFENKNLERALPEILLDIYKKKFFSKIFVINWPWSFTSLRVSSLCLNALNFISDKKIVLSNISKIDFYKYLVDSWTLPNVWIIYIWQKKNYWKYDFEKLSYELISWDLIYQIKEKYFIENVVLNMINNIDKSLVVHINYFSDNLIINFNNNEKSFKISDFPFIESDFIQPNYMIQPNIS